MARRNRPEYDQRYHAEHREERMAQNKAWRDANRERHRANERVAVARIKDEVITAYGGVCACCGTAHRAHLTIDHIEGGGRASGDHKRSQSMYRRLRREGFPAGYQVLCFNCNAAKHLEGGRCTCQDPLLVAVGTKTLPPGR